PLTLPSSIRSTSSSGRTPSLWSARPESSGSPVGACGVGSLRHAAINGVTTWPRILPDRRERAGPPASHTEQPATGRRNEPAPEQGRRVPDRHARDGHPTRHKPAPTPLHWQLQRDGSPSWTVSTHWGCGPGRLRSADGSAAPVGAAGSSCEAGGVEVGVAGERVLVVDDEPT